jgi:hypothetical protein
MEFDPRRILATGQRIFNPSSASTSTVSPRWWWHRIVYLHYTGYYTNL